MSFFMFTKVILQLGTLATKIASSLWRRKPNTHALSAHAIAANSTLTVKLHVSTIFEAYVGLKYKVRDFSADCRVVTDVDIYRKSFQVNHDLSLKA